jgi:hypothetical protein
MFNANSQKDIEVEIIFNKSKKIKKLKKTEIVKLRVSKNLKNIVGDSVGGKNQCMSVL